MKKVIFSLMAVLLVLSVSGCTVETSEEDELINGYYGPKAPEQEKEFGDIVFKDGSALPFTPNMTLSKTQKKYAIAVIFYKGTELNSGTDTTTVRTLGIGLKHSKDKISWCSTDADALDVFIDDIRCEGPSNDNFVFEKDKNGSDNLEQIENTDGIDDTQNPDKYPAFYFARNYSEIEPELKGTSYENGWYLPTYAEYGMIYLAMCDGTGIYSNNGVVDIDYISGLCGGSKFSEADSNYWTSNQVLPITPLGNKAAKGVSIVPFSPFYSTNYSKDGSFLKACAIREF